VRGRGATIKLSPPYFIGVCSWCLSPTLHLVVAPPFGKDRNDACVQPDLGIPLYAIPNVGSMASVVTIHSTGGRSGAVLRLNLLFCRRFFCFSGDLWQSGYA